MPDAATGRSEPHAPGGRSGGRRGVARDAGLRVAAGAPSPIGGGTAALLLDMDRVTTIIDRLGHMSGTAFCARSPIACGLARVPATRLSGYFAHRITNAAAEGLNARIQAIRVSARAPAGSATASTSSPPSTSTAAASTSAPPPTPFPDEPRPYGHLA